MQKAWNCLWPNDAIWRHISASILARVMASCLNAPSHRLRQCWLVISKVQWHLLGCYFTHKMQQPSMIKISLRICISKFHTNLSGAPMNWWHPDGKYINLYQRLNSPVHIMCNYWYIWCLKLYWMSTSIKPKTVCVTRLLGRKTIDYPLTLRKWNTDVIFLSKRLDILIKCYNCVVQSLV